MSRSMKRTTPEMLRALVRVLTTCVAILATLLPSVAWAVTPYSLRWVDTQASGSCVTADLTKHDGEAFFRVNDTPLPTYQVPGAFTKNADGSESNVAEAGFDSVLLHVGPNDFYFGVFAEGGDDSCVQAHDVVNLISVPLGVDKLLFDVQRDGTSFSGKTQVDLSLSEINPPLAQDIANLEAALTAQKATLLAHAAEIADLTAKLDALQQLDTELHDLVTRPLDEITQEDLDAILDRYADIVDEETRAALEQLLEDLQKSIEDLRTELASLIDEFGAQADAVADLVTDQATAAGFEPDSPWGYSLGPSDVPPVAIPDLSGVPGAFDPANDPYDAYADAIIAALAENVTNGEVTERAEFVSQVRAWRANDKAIAKALAAGMNVSQAETSAFLNAQNKVKAYVGQFMDAQDWFKDSPVPANVRAYVDGVLKNKFDALADQMKDALNNLPTADAIDLTQTPIFKTIAAFGGAMTAIDTVFTPYFEMMATLTHASTRVAIGFVPAVGPVLDFCEAVTGRAWCMSDGAELSTEERIFSGAGVAVGGLAKFWGGVKNAGLGGKAAAVADVVGKVDEGMAAGLRLGRKTYKTLKGAMSAPANAFEIQAGKALQEAGHDLLGIGDDGFRKMLGMPPTAQAPDYFAITKAEKIALCEAKGGAEVKLFGGGGAISQIKSGLTAVAGKGLGGDVDWVAILMKKGATFAEKDYAAIDGYLVRVSDDNQPVELVVEGIKTLVLVIEL